MLRKEQGFKATILAKLEEDPPAGYAQLGWPFAGSGNKILKARHLAIAAFTANMPGP